MDIESFCAGVLAHVPRATPKEREALRRELEGHVEDHVLDLEAAGCDTELAEARAVAAMGDPEEIGRALNAQLSPFWLWAGRGCKAAVALLCLVQLAGGSFFGLSRENVRRWEVWRAAQEEPWTLWTDWEPYPVSNRLDIRTPIGNDVLYIYQVDVSPVEHMAAVKMVAYDMAGPGSVADFHRYLTVETQGGTPQEPVWGGWSGNMPWYIRRIHYEPGDTYFTLHYDRFGERVSIDVPLFGEVGE
ncbi:permease prefix domain 1-containing protein [Pseudoflavonifractor phocaeensis]|uniref:permease prefix domain 1-containing protein n=1 Tax=Pseudoflavonifractor phocaeensis TaxID=1870988 RepID=UPI00313EFFC1